MATVEQINTALDMIARADPAQLDRVLTRLERHDPHVRTRLSATVNVMASSGDEQQFWAAVADGYRPGGQPR